MGVVLFAGSIGVRVASAQTKSADPGLWPSCEPPWPADFHPSGPKFTARIAYRGQPISGVKVILTAGAPQLGPAVGDVVATGETDGEGVAHFFSVPPGLYEAHIDKALVGDSERIYVEQENTTEAALAIEWPSSAIMTRHLRGSIRSLQKSSPQNRIEPRPHRNVALQLLDLRTGNALATVLTDSEGRYEFTVERDGLYVMRVGEHEDPSINSYDIPVQVSKDADFDLMPGLLVNRVCGEAFLEFENDRQREENTPTPIAISRPIGLK
jgi:hypothetical protein